MEEDKMKTKVDFNYYKNVIETQNDPEILKLEMADLMIKEARREINRLKKRANIYKCKHCGKVVVRESSKEWIKSYCEEKSKNTHLVKVKNNN
jgi:hypothetical protein